MKLKNELFYTTTVKAIQWDKSVKHPDILEWNNHYIYIMAGHRIEYLKEGAWIVTHQSGRIELMPDDVFHKRFTLKDK